LESFLNKYVLSIEKIDGRLKPGTLAAGRREQRRKASDQQAKNQAAQ